MSRTKKEKYTFDTEFIDERLLTSSRPIDSKWANLTQRKGYLRLFGGASLTSFTNQSIIGRPILNPHITIISNIDFRPTNLSQSAGLVSFFSNGFWQYLRITGFDNEHVLQIITCSNYEAVVHYEQQISTPVSGLGLKLTLEDEKVLFYISEVKHQWQKIGPTLNISRANINDNSLIGVCCLDHFERKCHADFEYYTYKVH